uniref:Uncharacterized protein n=1 Tax=Utricularia reniformis TaxID=192314 RepID=A0A1Y0B283_9LAMI|nr:hypothetical protein AEK19_MT1367 [Utricularia reniformis]ART31565.1 hypothetical protein AEK19_MT1367 [Utricularia reniformis]
MRPSFLPCCGFFPHQHVLSFIKFIQKRRHVVQQMLLRNREDFYLRAWGILL